MRDISDRVRNILIFGGGGLSLGVLWGVWRLFGDVWRCPFKMLTGLPCPGCGGFRAFELVLRGDLPGALMLNPLSVIVMAFFASSAVWLVVDIARGGRTWLDFWGRKWSRTATVAAIAVLLLNWVWNICKGL